MDLEISRIYTSHSQICAHWFLRMIMANPIYWMLSSSQLISCLESRDSKRKMMADMSCMPYNINHHPDVFSAELLLAVDFDGLECIVEYHFAFEWRYEEEYKIVSESLKIKQDRSKKFTTLINRDESSAQYKASDAARCNSKISVDDYELILNKLQAYEDLYYHSIICKLNNIEIYVDRYLDASSSYQPDPFIRKDFNELDLESLLIFQGYFSS